MTITATGADLAGQTVPLIAYLGIGLGFVAIVCLFVVLPWMILHYISKSRSAGSLSEEEGRMLEDLWRSARTMERRVETLERLMENDGAPMKVRPVERSRGDMN